MAVHNALNNIIKQKKQIENFIKQSFTSLALSTIPWLEKEFSWYNIICVFTSEQKRKTGKSQLYSSPKFKFQVY